jgi:uncharacterized protein (TIGR02285 family)
MIKTLLLLTVVLAATPAIASEDKAHSIVWLQWDLAPDYIRHGKLKGQGFSTKRQQIVEKLLPEYQHRSIFVSLKRGLAIFKKQQQAASAGKKLSVTHCGADFVSHPHADMDDYLSVAAFPFRGSLLVTRKEKAAQFGKTDEVLSGQSLLSNKALKLVLADNRPYGGMTMPIYNYIGQNPKQKNVVMLTTGNISSSMLSMVYYGRYDYTFAYADKLYYRSLTSNEKLEDYRTFKVKENDQWLYGFFGCNRTPMGKKIIEKINDIIRVQKKTKVWKELYGEWLPPTFRAEYYDYYDNVFLKQGDIFDTNPRSK